MKAFLSLICVSVIITIIELLAQRFSKPSFQDRYILNSCSSDDTIGREIKEWVLKKLERTHREIRNGAFAPRSIVGIFFRVTLYLILIYITIRIVF